jgi:murein DD-endopeptidase MepM/ murein hydrolase activator NlpD
MMASLCNQCARLRALSSQGATAGKPASTGSGIVSFTVISRRFRVAAVGLALICSVNLASARSQGQRPLQVSFTPATPQPGDVARVEISGANIDERMTASVFGQELSFHYDAPQQKWHALIGIDLDTKPGTYRMRIRRDGRTTAATRTLRIVPKQFRVRRLRVPRDFVDPPPEAVEQILRDNAALADAYARITPRKWTGTFVLPVDGTPTSNFGTRSYYNGVRRSPHAGVDFVGETGTPVRASNHGEVVIAAPMYFTGNTIVVDYGDRLFSVFAHLSELRVKPGDTVEPTTIVGLVGATGRVTGPHLHWSIRLNGARVDPLSLVAATSW